MTVKISHTSNLLITSQWEAMSLILSIWLKTPRPRKVKTVEQGPKSGNSLTLQSPTVRAVACVNRHERPSGQGAKRRVPHRIPNNPRKYRAEYLLLFRQFRQLTHSIGSVWGTAAYTPPPLSGRKYRGKEKRMAWRDHKPITKQPQWESQASDKRPHGVV